MSRPKKSSELAHIIDGLTTITTDLKLYQIKAAEDSELADKFRKIRPLAENLIETLSPRLLAGSPTEPLTGQAAENTDINKALATKETPTEPPTEPPDDQSSAEPSAEPPVNRKKHTRRKPILPQE